MDAKEKKRIENAAYRETNLRRNLTQKTHWMEPEPIKLLEQYAYERNISRGRAINEIIYQWAEFKNQQKKEE